MISESGSFVVYSDFVVEELKIGFSAEEINNIFSILHKKNLLLKTNVSESQTKEAKILCKQRKISFGDALHAVLARDNGAIMITRDKHFLELADIAEIRKPEDLI